MLSETTAQTLLNVLCTKYGFCLSPLWQARLVHCPPRSIQKFLNTVIHAEGLHPSMIDSSLYKALYQEVRVAFEDEKTR